MKLAREDKAIKSLVARGILRKGSPEYECFLKRVDRYNSGAERKRKLKTPSNKSASELLVELNKLVERLEQVYSNFPYYHTQTIPCKNGDKVK